MNDEDQLSFFLEWYDAQSGLQKGYLMHYYGDNTMELVERKTRKTFLKRIHIPSIGLNDLSIGSSITVYSRRLTILEPANEFTRQTLQEREARALVVITPDGYLHIGRIIQVIEQNSLTIRDLRMVQFQQAHLGALQTIGCATDLDSLLRDVSVVIEVRLLTLKAIQDAKAELTSAGISNSVLISSTGLEAFGSGKTLNDIFPTTAVLDNCTLCLVRPRILREARVGELLDAIIASGFEVSAMKLVHLQTEEAAELFQIYRGLVRQYQEMLKYMCSSPCLALEVRGNDVVRRFRDFCGPFDVQVAKILRPKSLRANFGSSTIHNALHCTECPEDGVLECQFVFQSLS